MTGTQPKNVLELAKDAYPRSVLNEIVTIYEKRPGGIGTVDHDAVNRVLDRFPGKTAEERSYATFYAGFHTR